MPKLFFLLKEKLEKKSKSYTLQVRRANMIRKGKTSRRPMIMQKESTTLLKSEKMEKFPTGPTRESPGPTFDIAEITAVKVVVKSKLSKEISIIAIAITPKYATKKRATRITVVSGTARPSVFMTLTRLG